MLMHNNQQQMSMQLSKIFRAKLHFFNPQEMGLSTLSLA